MPRGRPLPELKLSEEAREVLSKLARRPKTAQQCAQRARIVLASAGDKPNREVAAALDVKSGKVLGQIHRRHRGSELRKFLDAIERRVRDHLDRRLILDNYGTHETPATQR